MLAMKHDGNPVRRNDVDLVALLGQRYGDGLVYLRGGNDHAVFARAIELGLVSDDGYLTPTGHRFWMNRQS